MAQVWTLTQLAVLALAMGWLAERLANTGTHGWVVPVVSGTVGIYLGPRLARIVGWGGPAVGSHPVIPLFACALVACIFVKLVGIALESVGRR